MTKESAIRASRRVGVEVEFGNIRFADAVSIFAAWLGTEPEPVSDYEVRLPSAKHDWAFQLEVDWELLKQLARERSDTADLLRQGALELLGSLGERWVPIELVTPPLAIDELSALDAPLAELAAAGAIGTQDSLLSVYGTHFNPEVDPLSCENVVPQLRAFVVLQHWIVATEQIDMSRRLSQYAALFDRGYEALVLAAGYAPDWDRLIDDYLEHNPTRNRALDMLPLFAEVNEARVRRTVDDERIKARPTFHYRLADCRLGEPGWTLSQPWSAPGRS